MEWTKEQEQAIRLHDGDILVSAAAGSGKTAVLVERILEMVTDKKRPVDIDHLLIVTFTRAAAAEMRERIMAALYQRLAREPDNEHLLRQTSYIHNARISTIDGFCAYVIRNYFHLIDLDPAYRTADEGELKLLKREAAREVVEEAYEKEGGEFRSFVECCAPGRSDQVLEEYIMELYDLSMSHPWPGEWLSSCRSVYDLESSDGLERAGWMEMIFEDTREKLKECLSILEFCCFLTDGEGGPYMYRPALEADESFIRELMDISDYSSFYSRLKGHKWERLSVKRDGNVSGSLREQVKSGREQVKAAVKSLQETYFYMTEEEVDETSRNCGPVVYWLTELTLRFMECFQEKKRQKNLLDFADMEHLALSVLVERKEGVCIRTQAARELADQFEEILIDEYQDSNYVQEMLLTSVSRQEEGKGNIFMVGDVKQSIYRFRLANPELFMEKYHRYQEEGEAGSRIDLHQNFRSRKEVLAFVNMMFSQMMRRSFGGVDYDRQAALLPGASYPEKEDCHAEILMIERDSEEVKEEGGRDMAQELEARMIGKKIQDMMGNTMVLDKETGGLRAMRYSDCVILLRSISGGFGENFAKILQSMGIPTHVTTRTGYFTALEVVVLLNYLHICDNPRQDIPLASVLSSPIGGLDAKDLAAVRMEFPQAGLYDCIRQYAESGKKEKLRGKLKGFLDLLEEIRSQVPYTPIHQLILLILEKTGYGRYVQAMPGGKQRGANINMLQEKARDYEKTSYRGLFNFIRYIEQLQKSQVDFGEVNVLGEEEDTVRIMTIHKSKGLEFPVVFLSGLGKKFNLRDLNGFVVMHPQMGLGLDSVDTKRRVRTPSLFKQAVKQKLLKESLSEELRVLYVAVTRAKEKLILTGTIDRLEKRIAGCAAVLRQSERTLPVWMMENARDYWAFILPALARCPDFGPLFERYGISPEADFPVLEKDSHFTLKVATPEELTIDELERRVNRELSRKRLASWDGQEVFDEEFRELLQERFSFVYPYEAQRNLPVKMTVSELKTWDKEETTEELYFEPDIIPLVPRFIGEKEVIKMTGADRGTAYHRVLELLDYKKPGTKEEMARQLDLMEKEGKVTGQMRSCIDLEELERFRNSDLGERMARAAERGGLFREQPFTMSVPAAEEGGEKEEEAVILVQGIIDAYFYEEEGIVLADYKTDRVFRPEILKEKYKKQLDYYGEALERTTGLTVKEKIIYSFAMGQAIRC
ncbi:MAG: helicase-exonuclease AddAB subunit AddA [Ruminococcus sp.]|jgi:ATP-dependent helicase/nuclease subunit A